MTTEVSTKERAGEFDALETAKPDEPIFVVQGGDPLGPPTVQKWADLARERARDVIDGKLADWEPTDAHPTYEPSEADQREAERLLRKATNAEEVSWAMKAYQRGEKEPEGDGRATYNDTAGPILDEDQLDRAAKRKARIAFAGQLNNAVALAFSVLEGLTKIDECPEALALLNQAGANLKLAAELVEPRRGMERS